MGVSFRAKHLDSNKAFCCGYMSYGWYRMNLAEAIDPLFGLMYRGFYGGDWEKDEAGRSYADCNIDITSYIEQNVINDIEEDKPLLIKEAVDKFEVELREWLYGTTIDDVEIDRRFHKSDWKYTLYYRLSWEKMGDWVNDHLTEAHQNLFFAPDSEGRWSWQECREMFKVFSEYELDFTYRQDYDHEENAHQIMLGMWEHCWKNRVQLRWS